MPSVRTMIIWMVGEYSSLGEIIPRMLTTVLKYLAWCFTSEALETKLQILSTVTKVFPSAIIFLINYSLAMEEYFWEKIFGLPLIICFTYEMGWRLSVRISCSK